MRSLAESPAAEAFDVVVSDVRMPGWTGINVLATLARQSRRPPAILITAFGDDNLHEQAERAGAVAVLDMPFELDELQVLIDRVVAG